MKIIDTHCDVLYKMQLAKRKRNKILDFNTSVALEANLQRLKKGGIYIQFFALFLPPNVPDDAKWEWALEQIDLFKTEIVQKHPEIKRLRRWSDAANLKEGEIGAVLSLEGAEAIGKDLDKLYKLHQEGVLSVGLTWNKANACADGAAEEIHGGLTDFGREVVRFNNEHRILTDVSHLSDMSFWDVLEEAAYVFASHSNARSICDHPRNLFDLQISALLEKGGHIHVTFYPPFINQTYEVEKTTIHHLIEHVKHICDLGGKEQIGFGSDFDGIDLYIEELCNASYYPNLINELYHHFSREEVENFCHRNFLRFMKRMEGEEHETGHRAHSIDRS